MSDVRSASAWVVRALCITAFFLALAGCADEETAVAPASQNASAPALQPADQQRQKAADVQIKTLIAGLEAFKLHNTRYPTTEEGLDALIRRPNGLKNWEGPYLKTELPRDPWGNVFIYSGPRAKNKGDYKVTSYGADGRLGGEGPDADVSNRAASDERTDVPMSSTVEKGWVVSEKRNDMSGTLDVFVSRDAEHELDGGLVSLRPTLTVRCARNRTEVLVNVRNDTAGTLASSSVRLKLDSASPVQQRWKESPTGNALFAPNAITLAQQLAHTDTLLFEYTPVERREQLVKFQVAGLDKQLPKVAKACGWRMAAR